MEEIMAVMEIPELVELQMLLQTEGDLDKVNDKVMGAEIMEAAEPNLVLDKTAEEDNKMAVEVVEEVDNLGITEMEMDGDGKDKTMI